MACYFLQLPKDIISHILGYVLVMYHKSYSYIIGKVGDHYRIEKMCCENPNFFFVDTSVSVMSEKMVSLSQIHPIIRQILKKASIWTRDDFSRWHFNEHFFRLMFNPKRI